MFPLDCAVLDQLNWSLCRRSRTVILIATPATCQCRSRVDRSRPGGISAPAHHGSNSERSGRCRAPPGSHLSTYLPHGHLCGFPQNANPHLPRPDQSPSPSPHGRKVFTVQPSPTPAYFAPAVPSRPHGTTPLHPSTNHFLCSFPLFTTSQTLIHLFKPTSVVIYSAMPVPTPT